MARAIGSWLSGPGPLESGSPDQDPTTIPGSASVCPRAGPGSIAGFGRRIAALLIDWFIAYGLVGLAVASG